MRGVSWSVEFLHDNIDRTTPSGRSSGQCEEIPLLADHFGASSPGNAGGAAATRPAAEEPGCGYRTQISRTARNREWIGNRISETRHLHLDYPDRIITAVAGTYS